MDWLGNFITEAWNSIDAGDVADVLIGAGSKLASSGKGSTAKSGIIARGGSVGQYIDTAPSPTVRKETSAAGVVGLNERFTPVFEAPQDDEWSYMYRRLLKENA
jgi:hypothetical protein